MEEVEKIFDLDFLSQLNFFQVLLRKTINELVNNFLSNFKKKKFKFIELFSISIKSMKIYLFDKMILNSSFYSLIINYLNSVENFKLNLKK